MAMCKYTSQLLGARVQPRAGAGRKENARRAEGDVRLASVVEDPPGLILGRCDVDQAQRGAVCSLELAIGDREQYVRVEHWACRPSWQIGELN